MGRTALSEISSKSFLDGVWMRMLERTPRRKRDRVGVDGVSITSFEEARNQHLSFISRSVRKNEYKVSPLQPHFIPKPNKKERVICVPIVRDRLLQRSVLHYLNQKGYTLDNEISFGFIKGKSSAVQRAGSRATSLRNIYPWTYKADISAFFDRIDRNTLKRMVVKKIRARSLHNLIHLFIDTEISTRTNQQARKIRSKGIKEGIGLRQGMPISPYLANLFLADFDQEVIRRNIPMVRYADDLIAFGNSESECHDIHCLCVDLLSRLGLTIHEIEEGGKTVIAQPGEMVEFLGLGLELGADNKYKLVVTRDQMNTIKQSMLELAKLDYCKRNHITISALLNKLNYKISGYDTAYDICENREQLLDSIRGFRTLVVKRLFADNFSVDIESLSKRQKWFLEIGDS